MFKEFLKTYDRQNRFVQKAIDRFRKWNSRKDIYFDEAEARRVIRFVSFFKHYKGDFRGKPFVLLPFQEFIVGNIFGWKWKKTGKRVIRRAYIEIPRKNGKTTLASAIALYTLLCDREGGAEVYCVATKEDQAKITWKDCRTFLKGNEEFLRVSKVRVNEIRYERKDSFLKALGADSDTLDGLNPHCAVMDELHAWKNPDLYDVIDDGMGARSQPLIFMITTAGHNIEGICFKTRQHAINVLNGIVEEDELFAMIFTIDEGDDPYTPEAWFKANPALGVAKLVEYMEKKAKRAKAVPREENTFLNKQLNVWTYAKSTWVNFDTWRNLKAPFGIERLRGLKCHLGLDLSRSGDLTAGVFVFPVQPGLDRITILPQFFIPTEAAHLREKEDKVPIIQWEKEGYVKIADRGYIDSNFAFDNLMDVASKYSFRIENVAYDRFGSRDILALFAAAKIPLVNWGQNFVDMSPAIKRFEELILGEEMYYIYNPCFDWCMMNIVVETDVNENIRFNKKKSFGRIDGPQAAAMGIGVMSRQIVQPMAGGVLV